MWCLWLGLVVVVTGLEWIDVCDPIRMACGVHSDNTDNSFDDVGTFLAPNNPMTGPGWTIYINPYRDSCVLGNCTGPGIPPAILPPLATFYVDNAYYIQISNITICSYYPNVAVQFVADSGGVTNRATSQTGYNLIFVIRTNFTTLVDLSFTGLNGNYSRGPPANNLVPIQVATTDAQFTNFTRLTSVFGNVAVAWFGPTRQGAIDVTGVTLTTIRTLLPPNTTRMTQRHGPIAAIFTDYRGFVTVDATTTDLIWHLAVGNPIPGYYGDILNVSNAYNATDFTNNVGPVFMCEVCDDCPASSGASTTDSFTRVAVVLSIVGLLVFLVYLIYECIHNYHVHTERVNDQAAREHFTAQTPAFYPDATNLRRRGPATTDYTGNSDYEPQQGQG
jgi:hypothetical protein